MPYRISCSGCKKTLHVGEDVPHLHFACPRCLARNERPRLRVRAIDEHPRGRKRARGSVYRDIGYDLRITAIGLIAFLALAFFAFVAGVGRRGMRFDKESLVLVIGLLDMLAVGVTWTWLYSVVTSWVSDLFGCLISLFLLVVLGLAGLVFFVATCTTLLGGPAFH